MDQILTWLLSEVGLIGVIVFLAGYLLIKKVSVFQYMYNKAVTFFKINKGYLPSYMLKYKLVYWRDFKIDNIRLADEGRQAIFRDLLHIKFDIFADNIFKLKPDVNTTELLNSIYECFNKMKDDFYEKAKAKDIPDIVVEKFLEWNKPTVNFVMLNVESICNSPIYSDNKERLEAIYSLYMVMLETTIVEAERSLNELNGELTGIGYKGFICK